MDFQACLTSNPTILMEGALGERIKREFNIKINEVVAMANLVYEETGRIALKSLWEEYADISRKYHLPFIATTPTNKPLGYMTNCVHPTIAHEALSHTFNRTETVQTRFIGIQANTSLLSYGELDGAYDLKESSPFDFANDIIKLITEYHLKIVGGCCGTDNRHMEEIAKRLR